MPAGVYQHNHKPMLGKPAPNKGKLKPFDEMYIPVTESGCFLWTGATAKNGYGMYYVGSGKVRLAHRVAYERAYGEISDGLYVCHRCDVKSCINPKHFFLGTHADNQLDKIRKGRQAKGPRRSGAPDSAAQPAGAP